MAEGTEEKRAKSQTNSTFKSAITGTLNQLLKQKHLIVSIIAATLA